MKEHYYDTLEDNFGIITEIDSVTYYPRHTVVRTDNCGCLDIECCRGFIPVVGQKVELFITDEGWEFNLVNEKNV